MSQTVKLRRSATGGSVPTTSALALGELAINTYDGKLYLKKNVSGTETIVEIGANNLADTFNIYEYAVTSNTTVFSGADQNGSTLAYTTGSPPKVAVFLNGLLLDWGTDFTGTNGTSITLTSAAVSGDLVQIQAYKSEIYTGSNLTFPDNVKALFGNDSDLQIYHDGSHSYVRDVGTGNLRLQGTNLNLQNEGGTKNYLVATNGGAVTLYYDNATKLSTTSAGATVTGDLTVTGEAKTDILRGYTYGGSSFLDFDDDSSADGQTNGVTLASVSSMNFLLDTNNNSDNEFSWVNANTVPSSGTKLMSLNQEGYLSLFDDGKVQFGNNQDLRLYHNGTTSNSNIENHTGGLFITNYANDKDVIIRTDDGSGGVTEYMRFDGSDTNIAVSQHMRLVDSKNIQLGTSADFQLYHNGTNSYIRNYTGNLEIINEQDDGDIRFFNDNGSGGLTEYVRIDGGWDRTVFERSTRHSDNAIATFGTGEDLQIYHDGTQSVIQDVGTGQLKILGENTIHIGSATNNHSYIRALKSGAVELYHNNVKKFETKSDGVDIIGELQADSLDIDGAGDISGNLTIGGNLTVNGSTTTLNTATLDVEDLNITVAKGATNNAAANGAGLTVDCGSDTDTTFTFNGTSAQWETNTELVIKPRHTSGTPPTLTLSDLNNQYQSGIASSGHLTMRAGGSGNLYWQNSGTYLMTLANNGNLAIGNAAQTVTNARVFIKTEVDNSVAQGLVIERSANNDRGYINYNGGGFQFRSTVGDPIVFGETDAEHMRILPDGNVGIGNTAPSAKLEVQGTSTSSTYQGTSPTGTVIRAQANSGTPWISSELNGATAYFAPVNSTTAKFAAYNYATSTEMNIQLGQTRMYIQNDGKVGIGTTSLTNKFHVSGDARIEGSLMAGGAAASNVPARPIHVKSAGDAAAIRIEDSTSSNLAYDMRVTHGAGLKFIDVTNNATRMTLTDGGQVAINTDTARTTGGTARLTISDSASCINMGPSNSDLMYIRRIGAGQFQMQTYNNNNSGNLELQPYGGKVGIGTGSSSNPQATFQVEEYGIDTTETSTSATTQTVIHSMSATVFRSARFTIQVTNSTDSTYHTTEILMVHDGTNANITEFGKVFTANEEATFDADVSSGNVRLFATPATTDSMEFKVVCHSITV